MNKDISNAVYYILFLLILILFFHTIEKLIDKYDINFKVDIDEEYLTYLYILFFAIISGFLLLYGFKNFNKIFYIIFSNKSLAEVTSASIVISFSFLYSAYFQNILEKLLKTNIKINAWKNIKGYAIGRLLFIFFIFVCSFF